MNLVVRTHQDSGVWIGRRGPDRGRRRDPAPHARRRQAGAGRRRAAAPPGAPSRRAAPAPTSPATSTSTTRATRTTSPTACASTTWSSSRTSSRRSPCPSAAAGRRPAPRPGLPRRPAGRHRRGGRMEAAGRARRRACGSSTSRATGASPTRTSPAAALADGRPEDDVERRNHGTNVLGMLGARHNGRGINGICPDAQIRAVSYQPEDRWGSARAIKRAADLLRPGDIMLLEMMRPGPRTPPRTPTTPARLPPGRLLARRPHRDPVRDLARRDRRRGRRQRRPAPRRPASTPARAPASGPAARTRSCATAWTPARSWSARARRPAARHGPDRSRLDVLQLGHARSTPRAGAARSRPPAGSAGADGRDRRAEDRWYTERFSGTSSAAPMVAGALACVQGVLRAAGRRPLTPAQARAALRETGSPQQPRRDGDARARSATAPTSPS